MGSVSYTHLVTGTASKGAALFRKKAAAEARKRIKKVEAGKKLAKRTAKKAAKDTAKAVAKETAKETAKTTAKVAAKTATKTAATAAGTAVAPGVGTAIGMAAGYAAGAVSYTHLSGEGSHSAASLVHHHPLTYPDKNRTSALALPCNHRYPLSLSLIHIYTSHTWYWISVYLLQTQCPCHHLSLTGTGI